MDGIYLSTDYYGTAENQIERLNLEARSRVKFLAHLAGKHGLRLQLLDIGCASGIFLRAAVAAGWSVSGVERSPITASTAQSSASCAVTVGIVEELDVPGSPFPVVTAWEVLEHAVDPKAFFRTLGRNVEDGGLLAISTPLSDGLVARLLGVKFPMLTPPEHLSLFSKRSLETLAADNGFRVVSYKSFSNIGIASLSSGICKFVFGKPPGECSSAIRGVARILATTLAWAPHIIDAVGMGSEMQVVFVKSSAKRASTG